MIPTNYDNDDEEDDMTGFEVENDPSLTKVSILCYVRSAKSDYGCNYCR